MEVACFRGQGKTADGGQAVCESRAVPEGWLSVRAVVGVVGLREGIRGAWENEGGGEAAGEEEKLQHMVADHCGVDGRWDVISNLRIDKLLVGGTFAST